MGMMKRGLAAIFIFSFALVSPCLAGEGGSKVPAEVKAVMEQHNKAFKAQDLKGVMSTYSQDRDVVLMGTGPGEVYVGDEAIGAAYDQFFSRFDANTLDFKAEWLASGVKGKVAWFAVTTTIGGALNNEKQERAFNMSGTLVREKGKWRILSLHFSRLGAEQQAAADKPK